MTNDLTPSMPDDYEAAPSNVRMRKTASSFFTRTEPVAATPVQDSSDPLAPHGPGNPRIHFALHSNARPVGASGLGSSTIPKKRCGSK